MANQNLKKYVTDLIDDDYKSWKPGDSIILQSGTGTGKSTFCIKTLCRWAKKHDDKVLYVCNRTKLEGSIGAYFEQMVKNTPELAEAITVTKYQNLEKNFGKMQSMFKEYKYIFLDECHYFISDATMNQYTERLFDYIMEDRDNVLIFASATAEALFSHIIKRKEIDESHIYNIATDYSFVDNVFIYDKDDLITILNGIIRKDAISKIAVFCSNGDRIMEIYDAFGPSLVDVYCSKSLNDKRVTEIRNNNAIKNCKFKKRILIATSVVDNGIDLKDVNLRHIFTEMVTIDSLIQTLGRKRPVNDEDYCTYYIRERKAGEIVKFVRGCNKQLALVDLWKEKGINYFSEYGEDRDAFKKNNILWYDALSDDFKINSMAHVKYTMDKNLYDEMIADGFVEVLTRRFPDQLTQKIRPIDICEYNDPFLDRLKSFEGIRFYKDDFNSVVKELFKQEMDRFGIKSHRFGRETLNSFLDETYGELYKKRFVSHQDWSRKLDNGEDNPHRGSSYNVLE